MCKGKTGEGTGRDRGITGGQKEGGGIQDREMETERSVEVTSRINQTDIG
jgi:hypothetical protein